jgi:rSAM/selenodomain-associated transferase 1
MKRDLLIVFAKEPVPGRVKTRLAKDVGAGVAAALYDLMLRHVIKNVFSSSYDIELWKTSESGGVYFAELIPGAAIRNQPEGDIGERMSGAFRSGFAAGYKRICIIGTDCPGLFSSGIIHAFNALNGNELALGPSSDGGYYLIGLSEFHYELFEGISWSTGSVFSETVEKASILNIVYAFLPVMEDMDEICGIKNYILKNPGTELAAAFEKVLKGSGCKKEFQA